MPRYVLTILVLLFITASSQAASSPLDKFGLSADSMDRDYEKGVVYLKGKVNIVFGKKKLTSDKAEIWYNSKLIVAEEKANIVSDGFEMQGERIEYDYGNDVGKIFSGAVRAGKVLFKGDQLIKEGENEFHADYGVYTACDCDPPTWSFSGKDIDAQVGSYAYVKWPILRIADFPVFALPYIVVPLKSSRQTGLLLPTYESTPKGGSTIGEGFFWSIDESSDSTITLKNYELRGLKGLIEYRKRFSSESSFELSTAYLVDRSVYDSERFKLANLPKGDYYRWYLNVNQFLELPENYTQRLYLNMISDLQYITDFPQEMEGAGNAALENHYSLTKRRDDLVFVLDTTMYTDLLQQDPLANNSNAVHRLPEIRLSLLDRPLGNSGFSFRLDSHYVNFARNGRAWDDICVRGQNDSECPGETTSILQRTKKKTPDGSFSPNYDLIRTGQRLDFQPTLSYSYRTGPIDIVPSISYRETLYHFPLSTTNFSETVNRRYLQTQISTRIKTFRVYGDDKVKVKHEVVPEILWTNTPLISQPEHSFFGTSPTAANFRQSQAITDLDFYSSNKLQFDYNDRIYDRSLITFMLANKFIRKKIDGTLADYKQVGSVRFWQTYDLVEASKEASNSKPWSEISSLFDFRFDNFDANSLFQYFPYHNVVNTSVRMRVFSNVGNFAEVIYTEKFKFSDTAPETVRTTQSISPRVGLYTKYFNLAGGPDYNFLSGRMDVWSADLGLKPPGNCILISLKISQPLGGQPSFTAKFNMSFDGT